MNAREFLSKLRREVESHQAINHALLARVAHVPFTREDYKVFGLQHYALVGSFTRYLELLLPRAPDSEAKSWIAKVLVDEYGEGSNGQDHAELYRGFLKATGATPGEERKTPLHPAVTGFIDEHDRICTREPFLVGLGALGPGHEWSIPKMFPPIVQGLRRARFTEEEIVYFTLHLAQDIDHGAWLEQALERYATTEKAQARARFWAGVQEKIVRWRQPKNLHLRTKAERAAAGRELALEEFHALRGRPMAGAGAAA
jgi:pyrroloquinoline quinone (PQQ) biosynthesis protein C